MRAILITTGRPEGGVREHHSAAHLPLLDRPFLQHVVERLVEEGIETFDFLLGERPEETEALLGDGTRWGSTFHFHVARDAESPYRMLAALNLEGEKSILLCHADVLPDLPRTEGSDGAVWPQSLYYWRDGIDESNEDVLRWTGWAHVRAEFLVGLNIDADREDLERHLATWIPGDAGRVVVPEPLMVRSYKGLLDSHRRWLSKQAPNLMVSGREREPGIWLGRNVSLHATATLSAPVYIGENCRIGARTKVGPNAVLGGDCVIDRDTSITETVVMKGSYIGEGLELDHTIVDRCHLISIQAGTHITIKEDFLIGDLLQEGRGKMRRNLLSRAAAVLLLLLTWPVILLTALCLKLSGKSPVWRRTHALRLPAEETEREWEEFRIWSLCPRAVSKLRPGSAGDILLRVLPMLFNVVRGEMSFVGVAPRSVLQIRSLPEDWRALYLRSKVGIVTESDIIFGAHPSRDEHLSAESCYAIRSNLSYDLKLLLKFIGKMFGV